MGQDLGVRSGEGVEGECDAPVEPAQRAVVVARFWEGLPSAEIAARLGYRSAAVVDTILARAERRLRERFPGGIDAVG